MSEQLLRQQQPRAQKASLSAHGEFVLARAFRSQRMSAKWAATEHFETVLRVGSGPSVGGWLDQNAHLNRDRLQASIAGPQRCPWCKQAECYQMEVDNADAASV